MFKVDFKPIVEKIDNKIREYDELAKKAGNEQDYIRQGHYLWAVKALVELRGEL